MAQYKYKAQTYEGKKKSGVMNAADEAELQLRLREEGALLLSAKLMDQRKAERQIKPKVLSDFSRQLGTLISAGVTLVRSLNIIASSESIKPREKRIYEDMLRQIRQGVSLSDAMEAQNGAFPPLMVYMYRSAESSGNLDQVAMQMADHYEKDHRLNAKISTSMVYPKILGVMIIGVILVLTKFVMPQFQELFDQMETLPLPTRILYAVSDFMAGYWVLVIVLILGIWVGIRALLRVQRVRIWWHRKKLHIPLLGKLWKTICTSRFSRTLSALYASGIPIVPALQIARKTIGNDYIDAQFDDVIPFVRAGNNLSDGLDMVDGFVRKLSDSIRVGEETGSLDTMLLSTSNALEFDADAAVTKMVSYVEPVMLIIMGIIVAFVMVAVFSALYGSYDSIAGME
ncbi:type II secretion system F family protein [Qiania dongpingensis]|uniref:Type II secretion system F family protein n=1 Tax=Qiania dongpingensis TaxID=2763669 RepID=A0A7G9G5Q0_9FIRM|nr:type II secretion system F family protein [Qiania dongpingensis]QNM06132.1 type II secretion system F family protein [Qiania dongpingensis]